MLYQTIDNASQMRDAFYRMDRGNQFSYEAIEFLYDFYGEMGEDVELDVIGICCDWTECDSEEELAGCLNVSLDDDVIREEIMADDEGEHTEAGWDMMIALRKMELIREMKEHDGVYELENGHFLVENACI